MENTELIISINKEDKETIELVKRLLSDYGPDAYSSNGLSGAEVVAIAVVVTPELIKAIKEIILKILEMKKERKKNTATDNLSFTFSNDYGAVTLSAKTEEELFEKVERYLKLFEKSALPEAENNGE